MGDAGDCIKVVEDPLSSPHLHAHQERQEEHPWSESMWPSKGAKTCYRNELCGEDQPGLPSWLCHLTLGNFGPVTVYSDCPPPHWAKREPAHVTSQVPSGLEIPVYNQGINSINKRAKYILQDALLPKHPAARPSGKISK